MDYNSAGGASQQKPSACWSFLHYTWKTITFLISHITLIAMVVSYCVLGAFTFEALEKQHEIDVKKNISQLRDKVSRELWTLTNVELEVLEHEEFVNRTEVFLKQFEGAIIKAMTKDGWDGEENPDKVQWSRTGALFYSIIVITTIGYGHIAPKTPWGKIVTIFYAILGIPLMLLCLSNIGDIMATSFRFLYWRVCCYVCTKKPNKRKRAKSFRGMQSSRPGSESRFSRSRPSSFRRSVRNSTRSADSGFGLSEIGPAHNNLSHSDTELRFHNETARPHPDFSRGSSLPRLSRQSRSTDPPRSRSNPPTPKAQPQVPNSRGGSLDRKKFQQQPSRAHYDFTMIDVDPVALAKTPILCNRYVVGKNDVFGNNVNVRAKSLPNRNGQHQQYLELPGGAQEEDLEGRRSPRPKRKRSPPHQSPKMMTPLGYGHRSKYLDDPDTDISDDDDYSYYYDDFSPSGGSDYESSRTRIKPVPIWLCVFLVVSYIVAGAFLFQRWENWTLLDAAYFCFITLTTIGFGDLVPAKGVKEEENIALVQSGEAGKNRAFLEHDYRATISITLCSLYLLFGIALLAMSFNLVQEEVISNVKSVARTLGIIKKEDDSSEEDG